MSRVSDEGLRPHLTALIDGELLPLEAIALQRRLRQSRRLETERRELERLKVAVHLAGTRDESPRTLERSLEAMCREHFEGRRRRRSLWAFSLVPATLAAGAVAALLGVLTPSTPETPPAPTAHGAQTPPIGEDLLDRLADFHREAASPLSLADLKQRGALIALERLPDTFITPEGQKPQVIQASWMGCAEREVGATLAVLSATEVELPRFIQTALETTGVYVDLLDGVHVRVSVSGDKLFVLMSTDLPAPDQTPI